MISSEVKTAIELYVEDLLSETEDLDDALSYLDDMVNDINTDCELNYTKGTKEYNELYQECKERICN